MTKTIKESGEVVKVLAQYRGQSNNYVDDNSRVYADLYKVQTPTGSIFIKCQTELE